MGTVGVIPARMASSRFPGKPLARILGLSMIEHVYRRTAMSRALDRVMIATCDEEIADVARGFGAPVAMTSPDHQRASDRVAEVARELDADIVVMIQGDEPQIRPEMIEEAVEAMDQDASIACVNLAARIEDEQEFRDPNTIKVVVDRQGDALFFSREPIPTTHLSGWNGVPALKQVCVIPFRRWALLKFADLDPTPLEKAESVDMLRFLENGMSVRMVPTAHRTHAVDHPSDLSLVEAGLRADALTRLYVQDAALGGEGR